MIHSYLNRIRPVFGFDPGLAVSTQQESDWVHFENYLGAIFIAQAEAGAAADDTTVRLQQATSNAGGGAKNLIPRMWYRQQAADIRLPAGQAITAVAAVAAGCAIEGGEENLVYCEVDAAELDVNNDFKYARLVVDDKAGATGKLASCVILMTGPHQVMQPDKLQAATP